MSCATYFCHVMLHFMIMKEPTVVNCIKFFRLATVYSIYMYER